jgi:hypothetical protein
VFAPDIDKFNLDVSAIVTLANGTRISWELPDLQKADLIEKMKLAHLRKYLQDNLAFPQYRLLCPDACRYVARAVSTTKNPARSVSLIMKWTDIPLPGDRSQASHHAATMYAYTVRPEDLQ